jgi:hypothetical protein
MWAAGSTRAVGAPNAGLPQTCWRTGGWRAPWVRACSDGRCKPRRRRSRTANVAARCPPAAVDHGGEARVVAGAPGDPAHVGGARLLRVTASGSALRDARAVPLPVHVVERSATSAVDHPDCAADDPQVHAAPCIEAGAQVRPWQGRGRGNAARQPSLALSRGAASSHYRRMCCVAWLARGCCCPRVRRSRSEPEGERRGRLSGGVRRCRDGAAGGGMTRECAGRVVPCLGHVSRRRSCRSRRDFIEA